MNISIAARLQRSFYTKPPWGSLQVHFAFSCR
jgi:hypothetical protein